MNPEYNKGRIEYFRQQAIIALELTKGFTPEQREQMSNALKTVEDFAAYILELTQLLTTTKKATE